MTRLQKKCLIFSLSLHGLVAVILIAGSGFRSAPPPSDLHIMTLLSPNILDRAGSGGGTPIVSHNAQSQPKPEPPRAQPTPPQPRPAPTPVQPEETEHVERAALPTPHQPREIKETKRPQPDETDVVSLERAPKPPKHTRHQVQVDYTPASSITRTKRTVKTESTEAEPSSSRAAARRLRELQNSLDELASGVRTSGSPNTIVDVVGIGGGEAFTGYRDAIFSAYYNAWITPDALASRSAFVDARVTIARDGSIVSAEVVRASDDRILDRSVEQALHRVDKLPPFPASSHDTQRTFTLRFSPQAKELSG